VSAAPLAAALVLAALSATAVLPQVRVVDEQGRPVAGARVEAFASPRGSDLVSRLMPPLLDLETDADGSLAVRLPRVDGTLLLIDHPGFSPWSRELAGGMVPEPIRLSAGGRWQSRVLFPGRRLTTGEICAVWRQALPGGLPERTFRRCAPLAADGDFVLAGLPHEAVTVEVDAAGYLPLSRTLVPGAAAELRLRPGVLVRGTVLGPRRAPVEGARITSERAGAAVSGRDGRFELAVPALPTVLSVRAAGYRTEAFPAGAPRPGRPGLTLQLSPVEQLTGRLTDGAGRPLAAGELWSERLLADGRSEHDHRSLRTNDGDFRLDLPGPGRYRLRFGAAGHRPERLPEVAVEPGETCALGAVALRRGAVVQGTLVDRQSGAPLADADVELLPLGTQIVAALMDRRVARTTSTASGGFTLAGATAGRYELRVRRASLASAVRRVTLAGDETRDLGEIALDRGTLVHGRLTDRAGKPRPGLVIRLLDPDQSALAPLAEWTTDARGAFSGAALEPGRYRLQVLGARRLLSEEIDVPEGEELRLERTVGGVLLRGLVTRGGEPVAGGFLTLSEVLDPGEARGKVLLRLAGEARPEGWGLSQSALTADVTAAGTFELADAPAGLLWVSWLGDGGEVRTRRLLVPDQEEAGVTVEVGGVALLGRVVDAESGDGIAAAVRVLDPSGKLLGEVRSDAEGGFAVPDLEPGRYAVQARAEGFAAAALQDVEVAAAAPPLRLALEPGTPGGLRVVLRRVDGTPAVGVPATLLDASGVMVRSLPTDGAGERTFDDVPAGVYFLVWTDAAAGTGISGPVRLDGKRQATLDTILPEGAGVELSCAAEACAGAAVDRVALFSPDGVDLSPYLSGVTPALRLSAAGRSSLGRVSPGRYLLRVWLRGSAFERTLTVGTDVVVATLE
jgi:hypothetical protein